jgi:hypothetical protein
MECWSEVLAEGLGVFGLVHLCRSLRARWTQYAIASVLEKQVVRPPLLVSLWIGIPRVAAD